MTTIKIAFSTKRQSIRFTRITTPRFPADMQPQVRFIVGPLEEVVPGGITRGTIADAMRIMGRSGQ